MKYEYDSGGNKRLELFGRSDGVRGKVEYIYDDSMKLKSANCQGLNGWFYGIILHEYDKNGLKIGAILLKDSVQVGTITYSYSDSGCMLREYWDFPGKWNQTFIYEYGMITSTFPGSFTSSNVYIRKTDKYRLILEKYNYSGETGGRIYELVRYQSSKF